MNRQDSRVDKKNALMKVTCWIGPAQDFYHAARWLSGLLLLHKSGRIAFQMKVARGTESILSADPYAVALRIEAGGTVRLIAIDLRDRSDEFSVGLLSHCDLYFKRSYHAPSLSSLGGEAVKVRPLGLNYACRAQGAVTSVLATLAAEFVRSPGRGIRWVAHEARRLRAIPPFRLFERSPRDPKRSTVVFQTRVWQDGEGGQEPVDAINHARVELVRALREAFGPRFVGGLVPTPMARSRYPDALAGDSWRKSGYIAMAAGQLIGVYTRGLHQSTAWKLPEYMAASQCIVAEPPLNALPRPISAGIHYIDYRTPSGCIAACQSLMDDPAMAMQMREANHRYYCDEVAPAAWAANRLEEVRDDMKVDHRFNVGGPRLIPYEK